MVETSQQPKPGVRPYHWKKVIGRLQLMLHVWHHTYSTGPDRWVFQPVLIWDRKRRDE